MNTITLTVETMNKLTAYLFSRPFQEVDALIQTLRTELTPKNTPVTSVNVPEATNTADATVAEEERDLSA